MPTFRFGEGDKLIGNLSRMFLITVGFNGNLTRRSYAKTLILQGFRAFL